MNWDNNTPWDGGVPWALGEGEGPNGPQALTAANDAIVLLDAGGAAGFVVQFIGGADTVVLVDAGGSAQVSSPPDHQTPGFEDPGTGRRWDASSLQRVVKAWPSKLPVERVVATFDFAPDLQPGDAVASCAVRVDVVHGFDPSPSSILTAAPAIKGRRVLQALDAGVGGCVYLVQCQATTHQGSVLVLARLLPVATLTIH